MEGTIYLLCAATSLACAVLLLRGYWRNGLRLLLWSGICFLCLTGENIFLFVDVVVTPNIDLSMYRSLPAVVGISLLLYGLIWNAK